MSTGDSFDSGELSSRRFFDQIQREVFRLTSTFNFAKS